MYITHTSFKSQKQLVKVNTTVTVVILVDLHENRDTMLASSCLVCLWKTITNS